VTVSHVICFI